MASLQQSATMKLNSFCKRFIFIVFEVTNDSAPDIKYIYKCTCVLLFGSTDFILQSNLLFAFQRFALDGDCIKLISKINIICAQ